MSTTAGSVRGDCSGDATLTLPSDGSGAGTSPFGDALRSNDNGDLMKVEGGERAFGFKGEEAIGEVYVGMRVCCGCPTGRGEGTVGRGLAELDGGCPGTMECFAVPFAAYICGVISLPPLNVESGGLDGVESG